MATLEQHLNASPNAAMTRTMVGERDRHTGRPEYYSSFSPSTGTLMRAVSVGSMHGIPRAPSPELIDIAITNKCHMACNYCYQDSTVQGEHSRPDLVSTTIKSLKVAPYQIAIGGGEPTLHPAFCEMLQEARALGTVPNYTTAGYHMTDEIFRTTNAVCGGVAMTYHAFKGTEWFLKHYGQLRERLTCQVNVHLVVDKNVVETLPHLVSMQEKVGKMNVVLLAFYPEVGRATLDMMMTRQIYMKRLPDLIQQAADSGMNLAFSEGLLPFFLSRPELPINTTFAMRAEGLFSCYVDSKGAMYESSFDKNPTMIRSSVELPKDEPIEGAELMTPEELEAAEDAAREIKWEKWRQAAAEESTVYTAGAQALWDSMWSSGGSHGEACYSCPQQVKCSSPLPFHYFTCAHAQHNKMLP